jgi:hypothetical protein
MKKIKISLWLLIPLFMVSCAQEEGALYENPEGKVLVSLVSAQYDAELAPEDGTEIIVQVNRNTTKGAFDASFRFESKPALFTMPDSVAHFADGESTAQLKIAFPGSAQMGIGESYELTVSLSRTEMLSAGGISQQKLTLKRRLTWVDAGTGKWKDGLVSVLFSVEELTYDVDIQKTEETEGLYRLVNPYGYEVYAYTDEWNVVSDPCYVMINAIDASKVFITEAGIGVDYGIDSDGTDNKYGEIYVKSMSYGTRSGKTITFPAGTLAVGMRKYNDGALLFGAGECILELP